MKGFLLVILTALCAIATAAAAPARGALSSETPYGDFSIRENTEIREQYMDIIRAPTSEVMKLVRKVFTQRGQEGRVLAEASFSRDAFYILFINEENDRFPVDSRGSWIIKRDIATGDFVQVKIFYQSDPGAFVRIFPGQGGAKTGKAMMDVFLAGRRIQHDVPIGSSFDSVLGFSFAAIVDATSKTVAWEGLIPPLDTASFRNVEAMTQVLRSRLADLSDADDGAMDRDGKMVFIATLAPQPGNGGFNCSGFAKWVADGLYEPLTGTLLDIGELKTKHLGERGNFLSRRFEDERDPYFGLDWSRNIALAFARREPGTAGGIKSCDINELPYWKYIEDVGYPSQDIPAALNYLALTEPGYIYIASVNREFGKDPVLRQHTHVAFVFPVLDMNGRFSCAVMERNQETSLNRLIERGDFIHLVRVKARAEFNPPAVR